MASCDDTEPLDIPDTWDYGVKIPPYTLSDRAMPSCLTLEDLYAVVWNVGLRVNCTGLRPRRNLRCLTRYNYQDEVRR